MNNGVPCGCEFRNEPVPRYVGIEGRRKLYLPQKHQSIIWARPPFSAYTLISYLHIIQLLDVIEIIVREAETIICYCSDPASVSGVMTAQIAVLLHLQSSCMQCQLDQKKYNLSYQGQKDFSIQSLDFQIIFSNELEIPFLSLIFFSQRTSFFSRKKLQVGSLLFVYIQQNV